MNAFLCYISELNDFMSINGVTKHVLRNLLSQSSEAEFLEAKFEVLAKSKCPNKSTIIQS